MPVLLLARGDQESRNCLRRAIEARYGLGPQALESLKLEIKGRTRAKLGPVATWIPLEGIAYFKFPFSIRWNFTTHTAGLVHSQNAEAFDGQIYRRHHGSHTHVVADSTTVTALRAQVWTIGAQLLMPLSEPYVELRASDARSIDAINHECGVTAHLDLNEDYSLHCTSTIYQNPANGKPQSFALRLMESQHLVGDLMLPAKVALEWDDRPEMELTPIAATVNPPLDDAIFRLADLPA